MLLNVLTNAHKHALVTLLYTNCVTILTYACAVKQYSPEHMTNCNITNVALRKIFGFVVLNFCISYKKSQRFDS